MITAPVPDYRADYRQSDHTKLWWEPDVIVPPPNPVLYPIVWCPGCKQWMPADVSVSGVGNHGCPPVSADKVVCPCP